MNNLTKSITIHSAYGVEVEYENGTVCRVDVNQPLYNYTEKTISVHVAIQDIENKEAKLLLHSLDKLTKEIDGKVGIVELARLENIDFKGQDFSLIAKDKCYVVKYLANDEISYGFSYSEYTKSFALVRISPKEVLLANNQLELFNYLLEKGYNVFGLSSEFVKSKS